MAIIRGSAVDMSEVISFRLNKENPREAQAHTILKARYEEGHSIRHTITEALLRLDEPGAGSILDAKLDEITETLCRVSQLLERVGDRDNSSQKGQDTNACYARLTDSFLESIRKKAKPGMVLDPSGQ